MLNCEEVGGGGSEGEGSGQRGTEFGIWVEVGHFRRSVCRNDFSGQPGWVEVQRGGRSGRLFDTVDRMGFASRP